MDIDLNSDLGEGCENDAELMALITSANISCGFHAGDEATVQAALRLAAQHGVRVGAHPGFADRKHFGRRELEMAEEQIVDLCVQQVGFLADLAHSVAVQLSYIKPHGALYNMACRDDRYARPIVEAAVRLKLPVLALPGSRLEELSRDKIRFVAEGFADRRYQPDGSLVPRSRPDAFVHDPAEAVRQADQLIRERGVRSLCVHGDNPEALKFVRQLRNALFEKGMQPRPFV